VAAHEPFTGPEVDRSRAGRRSGSTEALSRQKRIEAQEPLDHRGASAPRFRSEALERDRLIPNGLSYNVSDRPPIQGAVVALHISLDVI
jgi:hypothetical protein